ncbi:MAG TPA: VWA domain-containing protein [Burkholderiales bacterium]|nr:VWA domain-containing protein [Burkholderiales bacterium]
MSAAGRLPENVMHFARLLRAAGMRIGPDRVIDCVRALELAGGNEFPLRRDDWYWTMSAALISRQEQRPVFDQAFRIFWRDPKLAERMMQLMLPQAHGRTPKPEQQQSQRLSDALFSQQQEQQESEKLELEARLTFSSREILSRMDFDTMSAAELVEAKKMLSQLRLPLPLIRTRRHRMHPNGRRIDLRKTLKESLREGGDIIPLVRTAPAELHPPLVVLCDISGSMNPYSRMFLHFLHAITNDRDRVAVFVFGTRLTNITRQLRHRDVDVAMARVAEAIKDWSGGTRIGHSLRDFNFKWGRRVLAQNACVLLVSDGLDREAGEGLGEEMERLAKSCHRLVWLNPLLRYEKFEARPAGVRAMLPHVDLFLPVHNLKSLVDLAKTLSQPLKEKPEWK